MTTNKPEVVAYIDLHRGHGRRYVSLRRGVDHYTLNDGDQLIRLSDYEALQLECEQLRKDAERYRWLRARFGRFSEGYDRGSDRVTEIVVNPDGWDVDPDSLDAAIDAVMETPDAP